MKKPSISIVTVTLNCAAVLPGLVKSLQAQDDQDFDWIVVDGGSTDATLDSIALFSPQRTSLLTGRDFGIYDALNKGVAACASDYYLVAGADDVLYPHAVSQFRRAAANLDLDIIAAAVDSAVKSLHPMRGKPWLRGGNAFVASHSVGTLIRRDLHHVCGFYSNRYVNCADMYFVLSAFFKAKARIGAADFVAGKFSAGGVSTSDHICSLSDAFRIQLAFGHNKPVQLMLYVYRLIRALTFR